VASTAVEASIGATVWRNDGKRCLPKKGRDSVAECVAVAARKYRRDEMNLNAEATHQRLTPAELELENARLQLLVADLVVKNQQLRLALKIAQRLPSY
jgi:hypothetical protein